MSTSSTIEPLADNLPSPSLDTTTDTGRLVVSCPDAPGIVAAVSEFLYSRRANIVQSSQYSTDPENGRFFLRTVFHLPDLSRRLGELEAEFGSVAKRFDMTIAMTDANRPKRIALFVSRYDHCLLDLLWRASRGQLSVDIGLVVSNHPDLERAVRSFGVPFHHVPVTRDTKSAAEAEHLELLGAGFDLVVLARYMQVLSADFLSRVNIPVINIHHSFLPAFVGARPYDQAKIRGVKLIGATAHYVSEDLDQGPIIEQDTVRVTHQESAADLARRGADVERTVLARAVGWHCQDRVLVDGNTTIVL